MKLHITTQVEDTHLLCIVESYCYLYISNEKILLLITTVGLHLTLQGAYSKSVSHVGPFVATLHII